MAKERRYDYYLRDRKGNVIRTQTYLSDRVPSSRQLDEALVAELEKERSRVAELLDQISGLERRISALEVRPEVPGDLEQRLANLEARPAQAPSRAPAQAPTQAPTQASSAPEIRIQELAGIVQTGFENADNNNSAIVARMDEIEKNTAQAHVALSDRVKVIEEGLSEFVEAGDKWLQGDAPK